MITPTLMPRSTPADWFFLLFGGIWLLVGAPLFFAGIGVGATMLKVESRLAREGRSATGVVTRKSEARDSVRYSFTAPAGEIIEDRADLTHQAWLEIAEGKPMSVNYAASDPHVHRVQGQRIDWVLPIVFLSIGGMFTGTGAVIFGLGVRRVLKRRRLKRNGVVAEGTITRVAQRNITINRIRQWTIYYTYVDYRGQSYEGNSGLISPGEARRWHAGDKGEIRFDPDHPEESMWTGKSEASPEEWRPFK